METEKVCEICTDFTRLDSKLRTGICLVGGNEIHFDDISNKKCVLYFNNIYSVTVFPIVAMVLARL